MSRPVDAAVLVCGTAPETEGVAERLAAERPVVVCRDTAGLLAAAPAAEVAVLVLDAEAGVTGPVARLAAVLGLLSVDRTVAAVTLLERTADPDARRRAIEPTLAAQLTAQLGVAAVLRADAPAAALLGPAPSGAPEDARAPERARALGSAPPAGAPPVPEPVNADQFEADVIWTGAAPLTPGRRYRLSLGEQTLSATVAAPKHRLDPVSGRRLAAMTLSRDEIGVAVITAERPIPVVAYRQDRRAGRFTLRDRDRDSERDGDSDSERDGDRGAAVATGLIRFALRRSQNLHPQALAVGKRERAALNAHRPAAVWFTGLSGAGKSAIANLVEQRLHAAGVRTYLLDGDNVRHGLNKDLGFTAADRIENVRRVAEVARLMVEAGLVVLAAFISPFRDERRLARELLAPGEFCEVFVDTPLALAEARDVKGLYAKARRGELANFTGIDSPYEPPERPEVRIDGAITRPDAAAEQVIEQLREMGVIP